MTLNVTQFREILWHQKGGVLMLSLNRPDKRNAINSQMLAELIFALESCAFDDSIRAVVIQGSGKGFCPGDDLSGMGELSEDYVSALQHPVTHAALQSCPTRFAKANHSGDSRLCFRCWSGPGNGL